MHHGRIISRAESFQILANDLRKGALAKHEAELKNATESRRREILDQIDRDIKAEIRRRTQLAEPGGLFH